MQRSRRVFEFISHNAVAQGIMTEVRDMLQIWLYFNPWIGDSYNMSRARSSEYNDVHTSVKVAKGFMYLQVALPLLAGKLQAYNFEDGLVNVVMLTEKDRQLYNRCHSTVVYLRWVANNNVANLEKDLEDLEGLEDQAYYEDVDEDTEFN